MAIYLGEQKIAVNNTIGVGSITPQRLAVSQNGTYTAPTGQAYTPVVVNIPSMSLNETAIRPDAELIKTFSEDYLVVDDLHKDIHASGYNTGTTTLVAAGSIIDDTTIPYNSTSYNYFIAARMLTFPIYSEIVPGRGMNDQAWCMARYNFFQSPSNEYNFSSIHTSVGVTLGSLTIINSIIYKTLYWSNDHGISLATDGLYGIIQVPTTPAITNNKIRIRNPVLRIRGHSLQFTEDYYNRLADIRAQFIIEVYRAPKNNLNVDGWGFESQFNKLTNSTINDPNHKLI